MKEILPYTEKEKERLKQITHSESNCPACGLFWLRDYPFPVRHCPWCGELKPWADKEAAV